MALAINAGLNDDDAFNTAVVQSLQEHSRQRKPPGDEIIHRLQKVGELADENEVKILQLRKLQFETRIPSNKPIPRVPTIKRAIDEDPLSASQKIRREQDAEYEEALRAAQEAELNAQQPHPEEEDEPAQVGYAEMIAQRLTEIEAEPSEGITIAVMLPNMERVSRRFTDTAKGEDVYVWIAANEGVQAGGFRLSTFALVGPDGTLELNEPISQQVSGRRTLLNLVPS